MIISAPRTVSKALKTDFFVSLLVGFLAFFIFSEVEILNPENIAWLENGDSATHYLGWVFFRNAPWEFPIGLNPGYGLEISSSIVFSDSIPLLAIVFKIMHKVLPQTFQYFGIWILLCFLLQAFFGARLARLINERLWFVASVALFFCFMPPMLNRVADHFALGGHFLVLAALYLSLIKGEKNYGLKWFILLSLAVLVQAYFILMIGILWVGDFLRRMHAKKQMDTRLKRQEIISFGFELLSLFFGVIFFAWQAGYFEVGGGVMNSVTGYGRYRVNLLAVFDPAGWSYILPDIPRGAFDHEGFNYFGGGVIVMLFTILTFSSPVKVWLKDAFRYNRYLTGALFVLLIYAITHKVGVGPYTLDLPLPKIIEELFTTFRASGRVFWPVFYFIIFISFYKINEISNEVKKQIIIMTCIVLQIVDSSAGWAKAQSKFSIKAASVWSVDANTVIAAGVASQYSKTRLIPAGNARSGWKFISSFSARNGLETDAIYLARINLDKLKEVRHQNRLAFKSGDLDRDTIYFMNANDLVALQHSKVRKIYAVGGESGLYAVLPR